MMMAADYYLEHLTREGERWDQIAYRYYGDPLRYEPIIRANPSVSITAVLPAAIVLRIPMFDEVANPVVNRLPPWKS